MPQIFGRTYSALELGRRIGRPEQLGGIREFTFRDGRALGVRAFDVSSGAGLRFTSLADRALDVCSLEFRGIPLVWRGPGGIAAPQYYQPGDDDVRAQFFRWLCLRRADWETLAPPASMRTENSECTAG